MTRASIYRRTAIVAGIVAVTALPVAAGVANASTTHPSGTHTATHAKGGRTAGHGKGHGKGHGHASAVAHRLATTTADVNIRTQPNVGRGSHVVTVVRRAATTVDVSCYVTGQTISRDAVWYKVTKPGAGYVAGHYLRTGHEPATGVSRCASSTHH